MIHRWLIAGVVATLLAPTASAHFTSGHIYVVDQANNCIYFVEPTQFTWKKVVTSAEGLSGPAGVGFTDHNDMLAANFNTNEILQIEECPGGTSLCSTVVLDASHGISGPGGANAFMMDREGNHYICNLTSGEVMMWDENFTAGVVLAGPADGLVRPTGVAILANGDLLIANEGGGGQILQVDTTGTVSTFDTIPGEDVRSLAFRPNGDVYVACNSSNVYRYVAADPAQRSLLGSYAGTNPSILFLLGGTTMIHVNQGNGKVRSIDPVTGVATLRVDQGWDAVALGVVEMQRSPGSIIAYGEGLEGTGAIEPELHGDGDVSPGQPITVEIHDFVGGALSFQVLGVRRTKMPAGSLTLYVDLNLWHSITAMTLPGTPGVAGEGDMDLDYVVPNDPGLILQNAYLQHFAVDFTAPNGLSHTGGLRLFIGE